MRAQPAEGSDGRETPGAGSRLTFSGFLRHLFFRSYDQALRLMILNIGWVILSLPWFFVAGALMVAIPHLSAGRPPEVGVALGCLSVCLGLISPPTLSLISAVGGEGLEIRESLRQLFKGVRRLFLAGQILGGMSGVALCILAVNAGFYARLHSLAGWAAAGVVLWVWAGLIVVLPLWLAGAAHTRRPVDGLLVALRLAVSSPLIFAGISLTTGLVLLGGAATVAGGLLGAVSLAGLSAGLGLEALSDARDGRRTDLIAHRRFRELWRPWEN